MKAFIVIIVLAAAGFVGHGYSVFSGDKVAQFLDKLEDDINRGRTEDACARLAPDVRFTLSDTTSEQDKHMSGGKEVLCRHFGDIARFYANAAVADNHGKSDVSTRLDWLHWNRAIVRYDDLHEITFFPQRTVMRAVAHQALTLSKDGDSYQILAWDVKAEPAAQVGT